MAVHGRRLKVAVFTDTYKPQRNGVVTFLSDFLPELEKHADVVLFAPSSVNNSKLEIEQSSRQSGSIKTYWVPSSPFPFYEGYRMAGMRRGEITRLLEHEKPDVVHLQAPVLLGLRALFVSKKMKIPVVATYHTHFPDYIAHLSKGLLRGMLAELAKLPVKQIISTVFSKADVVTAPTSSLAEELRSYGVKNAICVHNGISFSKFDAIRRKVNIRKKYGIPVNMPLILYVGRISFEKRIEVLLGAFRLISEKMPNAHLLIVGSGPYLNDYKRLAEGMKLKNVFFAGFVPDELLPSVYSSADVFASASDSETFGLTYVEAMHFGLPVVGVRQLGAIDVIKEGKCGKGGGYGKDGVGFLADPGSEKDIAGKIRQLLKDKQLCMRLGSAGRKESEKYDMQHVVGQFISIYRKLCRKNDARY